MEVDKQSPKPLTGLSVLLVAIISGSVIFLFIFLGQYAHPSADDFCMAYGVNQEGLFAHLWRHYQEWSGRYSGNAFYGIFPLIFGMEAGYRFLPVLIILSLVTAMAFFLSRLFKLCMDHYLLVLVSVSFVSVYLLGMVSTASSLYWLAGALTYQTANILLLLTLGLMIQLGDYQVDQIDSHSNRSYLMFFLAVLVVLGIGTNENNMLTLTAILGLAALFHFRFGWTRFKPWLALLLVALICFAIVYFSPGTLMRESTFPLRHQWPRAILGSLDMGLWTLKIWLSSPLFITASLLLPFAVVKLARLSPRPFDITVPRIVVLLALTILVPFVLQFPAWWSMGGWPPPRTVDAIYFVFLLGWFMSIGAITLRLLPNQTKEVKPVTEAKSSICSGNKRAALLLLASVLFSLSILSHGKFQRALQDLIQLARPYHNYMLERQTLIQRARATHHLSLIVPDYQGKYPRSVYFNDIMPFWRDWRNVCYANYYGLDRIKRMKDRRNQPRKHHGNN